jgi:hypothetical protein
MSITSRNSNDLRHEGAYMTVTVMPPLPVIQSFKKENKHIPRQEVHGLIDTGCSNTCIDINIAASLGLIAHDETIIHTPSGQSTQLLYDVTLFFQTTGDVPHNLQVCGANLSGQPYNALIGRDLLSLGIFIYNGIENRWDFCI